MQLVDQVLEKNPTPELVAELAELRIKNILCFTELEAFNSTGKFKGRHPLLKHFTTRQLFIKLKKEDPDQFLDEFSLCRDNIKRYNSFLKRDKITDKKRDNWQKQLIKHTEKMELMKEVMGDEYQA
jgi:hypothetical protein